MAAEPGGVSIGPLGIYTVFTANGHQVASVQWECTSAEPLPYGGSPCSLMDTAPRLSSSDLFQYGYDDNMVFKGWNMAAVGNMTVEELATLELSSSYIYDLDLSAEAWVEPAEEETEIGSGGSIFFKGEMPSKILYKGREVSKVLYRGHTIWPIETPKNDGGFLIRGGSVSCDLTQWQRSSATVEYPDGNYSIYESNSNYNTGDETAEMLISIKGYSTFTMYGYSDSEGEWDAMAIRQGAAPEYQYGDGIFDYKIPGVGNGRVPSSIGDWTEMRFTDLDPDVTTNIYVHYVKDSSVNSGLDRGHILIPENQYEYGGFGIVPVYNIENPTVRINTIKYEPGMTWLEWGNSEYVGNFYVDTNGVYYGGVGGYPVFCDENSTWINTTDEIQNQDYYRLTRWP